MSLTTSRVALLSNLSTATLGATAPKTVVELRDMMQRWADKEEKERSRYPRRNNDNNGKRHNDHGGPSNQRDPARKRKPDDTVGTMDHTPAW